MTNLTQPLPTLKAWLWMTAGVYFAVATVGGSSVSAAATLACGWFAGRAATKQEGGDRG